MTPTFPNTVIEMPNFSTDSAVANDVCPRGGVRRGLPASIATAAYAEAGIGPEDVSLAEVYDLSSALELDWYEDIGLCGEGEAEKLLRDGATGLGGRVPVNPSGGLSCFGEAIPPRRSRRYASASGSSGARPPGTRWRGPGWPSRPTKAVRPRVLRPAGSLKPR